MYLRSCRINKGPLRTISRGLCTFQRPLVARGSAPGTRHDSTRGPYNNTATHGHTLAQRRHYTPAQSSALSSYLVSPKELNFALHSRAEGSRVIPVCASWFMPNDPQSRTGYQTFLDQRIPGARFFDLDEVKDPDSPYPHMLPSNPAFIDAMGKLGIRKTDTVVVYDSKELGIFSAPRVAWTMKGFGHDRTHVLNNFKLYVEQGYPTESGEPAKIEAVEYTNMVDEKKQPRYKVDFDYMKKVAKPMGDKVFEQVKALDARSSGRFEGKDPEPRPGLSSGHMPRSVNVPFHEVLDPETKTFKDPEELHKIFEDKGIHPDKLVVSCCGTGVSAAVLDTALAEAGYRRRLLYDGSWTEWAQRAKPEENLILQGTE